MTDKQIVELMRNNVVQILNVFIDGWPWRYLFTDILSISWDILTADDYKFILQNIVRKLFYEYELVGRKYCTSIVIFIDFLENHSQFFKHGLIATIWMLPLPEHMKLTAISFVSSVMNIEETIAKEIRIKIFEGLTKISRMLLTAEKYDVINGFLRYFLKDDEKKVFMNELDITGFAKNLLHNADEEEEYKKIKIFVDWHQKTGDTLASRLINDIVESDPILKSKYDAYVKWHNDNYMNQIVLAKPKKKGIFSKLSIPWGRG